MERSHRLPAGQFGEIRTLKLSAAFECLLHGNFVGVLNVAAGGDAGGNASDFNPRRLEEPRNVRRRAFALHRGIGGENELVHAAGLDPAGQAGDAQLVGPDTVQRRESTVQYVIDPAVVTRFFDGRDVRGLFDHANQPLIPIGIRAINAGINVGDVVAHRAEVKAGFELPNGVGELVRVFVGRTKDVEREALRGLAAHAGKLLELVNQASQRLGKSGQRVPRSNYG